MQNKKNKRTLKRRIRRLLTLSIFMNSFIFSLLFFVLFALFFNSMLHMSSFSKANSISRDISSPMFLSQQKIDGLNKFDPKTTEASQWFKVINKPGIDFNGIEAPALPFKETYIIQINLNGKTVFDNSVDYQNDPMHSFFKSLHYNSESTVPITDASNKQIGTVDVQVNPEIIASVTFGSIVLLVIMGSIVFIFVSILSKPFSLPIIKPVEKLDSKIAAIANEDIESAMNSEIVLKKPLREIESLANSTNVIIQKMKSFSTTLENQKLELESQNEELFQSRKQIEDAQEEILKSRRSIKNLLDNAGQGFLSFGNDLLINKDYSLQCTFFFGCEISDKKLSELIFSSDQEQKTFLDNLLKKIFSEKDEFKRNIYIPLLPSEVLLQNRSYHIDYKIIADTENSEMENIMVILTDITDKRYLESQMESERNVLKMVVKVVVDFNDFLDCVNDFNTFCKNRIFKFAQSNRPANDLVFDIYRNIHTFKGNFSQFELVNLVNKLHDTESDIFALTKTADIIDVDNIISIIKPEELLKVLEEDISILKEILGQDFFEQRDTLLVDKFKLLEIENKMLSLLSPIECKLLLPDFQRLRFRSFKEILLPYTEHVNRLADRLEKLVNPMIIEGDDFPVDMEKYHNLEKSLINIFRNIVDHGIEACDERVQNDKEEYGNIICKTSLFDDKIYLTIEDDGRGIDLETVRRKTIEKGFYSEADAALLTNEELCALLFLENFSTRDNITEFSGRGMGLSAVKAEVEALGGTIEISTNPGEGTTFIIILPNEDIIKLPEISIDNIIIPLAETTNKFFKEQLYTEFWDFTTPMINKIDKLGLKNITSFIRVKGILEGLFVVTVDETLAKRMVENFVIDDLKNEEIMAYMEDTLAECSNIILGNSIKSLPGLQELIKIESPITINTEGASVKYVDARTWICSMQSEYGKLILAFVTSQNTVV